MVTIHLLAGQLGSRLKTLWGFSETSVEKMDQPVRMQDEKNQKTLADSTLHSLTGLRTDVVQSDIDCIRHI